MLWNKSFSLLIAANILLYTAVYMLFPLLHQWMMQKWAYSEVCATGAMAIFALGLLLPGVFNNYLVDAFSRKQVCVRSTVLLALLTLIYPYVPAGAGVWLLRVLQGALFGIVLMGTGSTLVIDVTPSNCRNSANRVFAWSGIVGMFAGLVGGIAADGWLSFSRSLYVSVAGCVAAAVLVSMVTVCFRAPLGVPFFSFDRFILFRTLLPGANMLAVPVVLGLVFASIDNTFFYLCMGGGFVTYVLIRQLYTFPMHGRVQILVGVLLMTAGLTFAQVANSTMYFYGGGWLLGMGVGFAIGQFLRMMILLPLHCERGTGYHTYQLLWELGVMAGVYAGKCLASASGTGWYGWSLGICAVGFLYYQLYIHRYFERNYQH